MKNETVLQRFQKIKTKIISSNIPNNLLLELIEDYITADDDTPTAELIPVLNGQLSLLDIAA